MHHLTVGCSSQKWIRKKHTQIRAWSGLTATKLLHRNVSNSMITAAHKSRNANEMIRHYVIHSQHFIHLCSRSLEYHVTHVVCGCMFACDVCVCVRTNALEKCFLYTNWLLMSPSPSPPLYPKHISGDIQSKVNIRKTFIHQWLASIKVYDFVILWFYPSAGKQLAMIFHKRMITTSTK